MYSGDYRAAATCSPRAGEREREREGARWGWRGTMMEVSCYGIGEITRNYCVLLPLEAGGGFTYRNCCGPRWFLALEKRACLLITSQVQLKEVVMQSRTGWDKYRQNMFKIVCGDASLDFIFTAKKLYYKQFN